MFIRILAFKTDLGDRGRLFVIHQFLPSMEMEVAVAGIMEKTAAMIKGAREFRSRGKGRDFVMELVPVKKRAAERMHPIMGLMMVLVT